MDLSGTIPLLKSQIQSLEREVQFLREDLKEKLFLVKSLVTAHVGLSEASLNNFFFKEIKSTAGSYNQTAKKNIASSADECINHAIDFEISEKIPMIKSSDLHEVLPESNIELEGFY